MRGTDPPARVGRGLLWRSFLTRFHQVGSRLQSRFSIHHCSSSEAAVMVGRMVPSKQAVQIPRAAEVEAQRDEWFTPGAHRVTRHEQ